jgi:hypothetical protein
VFKRCGSNRPHARLGPARGLLQLRPLNTTSRIAKEQTSWSSETSRINIDARDEIEVISRTIHSISMYNLTSADRLFLSVKLGDSWLANPNLTIKHLTEMLGFVRDAEAQ